MGLFLESAKNEQLYMKEDTRKQNLFMQEAGGGTGKDGKSAYEIWLEQGNVGTEEDFIESLKGEPGYTPQKGVDYFDGKDGYTPQKGVDYFDGEDGYTPQKGIDYFDGKDGKDYILTEPDKEEIAEKVAEKVKIPDEYVTETELEAKGYQTKTEAANAYQPKGRYATTEQLAQTEAKIPTKVSQLGNDKNYLEAETDPTVPSWAKQASKPSYTKSEVGLGNVDNVRQYSANNPPPYPVTSVNGSTGAVEVEPKGTAQTKVTNHNADDEAHNDIRLLISAITKKVNDLLASDDTTLDQMSEVVAYIKANRELLESYTTEKVNVADIIDNLTTSVSNKPLSAKQGVQLKALIDAIKVPTALSQLTDDSTHRTVTDSEKAAWDAKSTFSGSYTDLSNKPTIPTKLSDLAADATHRTVTDTEKSTWNNKSNFSGSYNDLTNKPTIPTVPTKVSAFTNDAGYQTAEQVSNIVEEKLTADGIPDYWNTHLESKIATIKSLQDAGGKDCFSFIVMADMHYSENLGKLSPLLAKKILDEINAKFVLNLGDIASRRSWSTKAELETEFDEIKDFLKPIADKLLSTQGNHDGSYGATLNGVTYPHNLTRKELYNKIYRPSHLITGVQVDTTGTAYYVDDTAMKVRYILLNTHCNDYELNDDGSVKYNNMKVFRFTQAQYDFLAETLLSLPTGYSVVVGGHVPISNLYTDLFGGTNGDHVLMRRVLSAYKNKASFSGSFAGTASGIAYKNLADQTSADWKDDKRINSSKVEVTATGVDITNFMSHDNVTKMHLKGIDILSALPSGQNYGRVYLYNADKTYIGALDTSVISAKNISTADYDNSVTVVDIQGLKAYYSNQFVSGGFIRFGGIPTDENIIITADQDIVESASGYDTVNVDVDFTNAKGEFVGYFSGHAHADYYYDSANYGIDIITTRCDGHQENDSTLYAEREAGTIREQSFDVFTVNKAERKIYATKIGAGSDRAITY